MPFVQFRVHPGIGCARMGNSDKAYHLASEFPYFLQEEFPNLRFKPKPRVHPKTFFTDAVASSAPGVLLAYEIYDPTPAFQNSFKESEGKVFPQAARFRVFAYVYDDDVDRRRPLTVFEVTTDIADVVWKVNIANKKSKKTSAPAADPHENSTAASSDLDTADTSLICKRIRPVAGLPNLAYIFLERDDADKSKVTGRLHVIGNEGELVGTAAPTSLWSDDWYDSAGDGSVQAIVKPKGSGAPLRALAGASSVADLKYFDYGIAAPQAGTAASITAMPGWVVIGCPDYVPDMGHFVSLWDVSFSRGVRNVETGTVAAQPGKHKLIRTKSEIDGYKKTDYLIHIHPHLCLFEDVKYTSGEAFGEPEHVPAPPPAPPHDRAHNKHPGGAAPAPDPDPKKTEKAAIAHGGVTIAARLHKADLEDPKKLKDPDPTKPIGEWLKKALYSRLRKPGTVYDTKRQFVILRPGESGDGTRRFGVYPRKLGRRMDYDRLPGAGDKNKLYAFPRYEYHDGNLLKFHGLADAGKLCGRTAKSPPTAGPLSGPLLSPLEIELLGWLDDMYWPATFSDMPLLRELAYTPLQYQQFEVWQGSIADVRNHNIFVLIVSPALELSFAGAGDADKHFADFLAARPLFAPAMIDMAHLGAMLGGSFLPGIEVGREAGVATNWCLFHGATMYFPSIRFKPCTKSAEHTLGTLTKDLAVPWSEDFKACDEAFWPTSRPGRTTTGGVTRHNWQIDISDVIPHLGATAANAVEFVKEYWKALGFIRRDPTDKFIEQEQSWH
jgi:hypothetical protein